MASPPTVTRVKRRSVGDGVAGWALVIVVAPRIRVMIQVAVSSRFIVFPLPFLFVFTVKGDIAAKIRNAL